MWILGVLGTHIQVTYDSAGYLVDAYGAWYETDGGQVFNSAGQYVGQLQTSIGETFDETRDLVVDGLTDVGKTAAISAAGAVAIMGIVGLWFLYKVVK